MSAVVISLLFTLGSSMWVYSKLQNHSGRNTQQSLTAAGVFALIIFIIIFSIMSLIS